METNNSMSLQEALDHLEKTNRRIPIMKLFSVWGVEELELLDQDYTQKDWTAFFTVVIGLNEGSLNPNDFLPLNAKRENKYKKEWLEMVEKFSKKTGKIILEREITVCNTKVKVQIGDQIVLSPHDEPNNLVIDTITEVFNPEVEDACFQVRTKDRDFDFTNFFDILSVYRPIVVHENPLTTQMKKLI